MLTKFTAAYMRHLEEMSLRLPKRQLEHIEDENYCILDEISLKFDLIYL